LRDGVRAQANITDGSVTVAVCCDYYCWYYTIVGVTFVSSSPVSTITLAALVFVVGAVVGITIVGVTFISSSPVSTITVAALVLLELWLVLPS